VTEIPTEPEIEATVGPITAIPTIRGPTGEASVVSAA
jgi:hypothetical protein